MSVLLDNTERQALCPIGLTPTQVNLLMIVQRSGGLTVSALARQLLCSRGNATRLVQRMVERDLIAVTSDDDDRRLVMAHITEPGRALLADAQQALEANASSLMKRSHRCHIEQVNELLAELVPAIEEQIAERDQ